MKTIISVIILFSTAQLFAQSNTETAILNLSKNMFKWEVGNKIDSLENLFHDKFLVVGSSGDVRTKSQYLATFKNGNFVHNSIDIEENTATVVNNTATVIGKGNFTVTVAGSTKILHLSYMEVFTKEKSDWKLMALYASKLPE